MEFSASYSAGNSSPQWLDIQLFQTIGASSVFLGNLGNPVANSTPTQWPQSSHPRDYTEFFDFSPQGAINLNPFSQYYITISLPANSPVDAALMFTTSPQCASRDEWTMGSTVTGSPYTSGEYLMLGVNATRIPDGGNTTVLLILGLGAIAGAWRIVGKEGRAKAH